MGMTNDTEGPIAAAPPVDGAKHRGLLGFIALAAGLGCMMGLFFVAIPPGNKEALILAVGIVLGWGSAVINYEFGSSPSGRKAAEAGIRSEETPK
jgi:uncharacterized RDD family membrane protein YckC